MWVTYDKVLSGEAKTIFLDPDRVLKISGQIYVLRVGGWIRLA